MIAIFHDMKIDIDKFRDNDELMKGLELASAIESLGFQACLVGGCVRDLVRFELKQTDSSKIHDIDIATSMPMEKLSEHFNVRSNNGEKHGTLLVLYGGHVFEVTHFRTDGDYADGRHPTDVKLTESFLDDTSRRDFTMNALGLKGDGMVVDYHGGVEDIRNKVIRTVGEPDQRFSEDALRMIRAVRFALNFDYKIEKNTQQAIITHAGLVAKLSNERIRAEYLKLCDPGDAYNFTSDMLWLGMTDHMAAFKGMDIHEVLTYLSCVAGGEITHDNMFAVIAYCGNEANLDAFVPTREEKRLWKWMKKFENIYHWEPDDKKYWTSLIELAAGDYELLLALEVNDYEEIEFIEDLPVARFIALNPPDIKAINLTVKDMGLTGKAFGEKVAELKEAAYAAEAEKFPRTITCTIGNSVVTYRVDTVTNKKDTKHE